MITSKYDMRIRFDCLRSIQYNQLMQNEPASLTTDSGSNREAIPHARMSPIRFLLLFILILVNFANQYTFNNPQAIEDSMETVLGISQTQFGLFYSLYALPNIFTLFFIGYLCDLLGVRLSLMCLSGGVAAFQLIIAIGGYIKSYPMILVGRIFFGIASEALFIPHASMISIWFQGTEQAFALGVGITFPQLGNALNSLLTPLIYDSTQNLGDPLLFSFGLCVVGFAFACTAAYIDKRADRIDSQNNVHIVLHDEGESEQIKLSDIKKLRRQYWIAAIICTASMSLWIPFLDNINRLFQYRFCYTEVSAGDAVSIAYFVAVVASIPLGLAVDYFGRRRILSVVGLLVLLIAQLIILIYPQCEEGDGPSTGVIAGLVFQGLGYAFYGNVLVAIIPLVCKLNLVGTAFGLMEMLESFAEFIIPIITGAIVGGASTPAVGYRISATVFLVIIAGGLVVSSFMFFSIKEHYKKKLDRSSHENMQLIARQKDTPELASSWSNTDQQESARRPSSQAGLKEEGDKESIQKPLLAMQIDRQR